jgi:hypothetical protein
VSAQVAALSFELHGVGRDRAPDPRQREHDVPRVPREVFVDGLGISEDRVEVVGERNRIEDVRRSRAHEGPVAEQHHRDGRSEVGVRVARPGLQVTAFEPLPPQLAVMEVEGRRSRHGRISDATMMSSSIGRPYAVEDWPPERPRRSSITRRFSSAVVCRVQTTTMSMSLSGLNPPRTADPWRYAPTRSSPSASCRPRIRRSICASVAASVRRLLPSPIASIPSQAIDGVRWFRVVRSNP